MLAPALPQADEAWRSHNADERRQGNLILDMLNLIFAICLVLVALTARVFALGNLPPGWVRVDGLRNRQLAAPPTFTDSDLVVGWPDTNETRVITGSFHQRGRIIVVFNGTLILDHASFVLEGDIFIWQNGRLLVQGGTFTVLQHFAYQYNAVVLNNGEFRLDSTRVTYNGQSWGNSLGDSARFIVSAASLRNGFTTLSVTARSQVTYDHADFASEYVIADSSQVRLAHCDTAMLWLDFPAASEIDISLPSGDTTIRHWEFHDSTPVAMGIGYRIELDTVSGVMWGAFPERGSVVIIRDCDLRATGLIFRGADSFNLTGFVNNRHYGDEFIPLPDRNYRLNNVQMRTWNFYPFERTRFVVESSVFGEMLSGGAAHVTLLNSICDGTGGYIGADSASVFEVIGSTINTQCITRGRAMLFAGNSNIRFWAPNATVGSLMFLVFSPTEYEPLARDTAIVFISDYRVPPEAQVGSDVAIPGTADIRNGPAQPVGFGSYQMLYASADSPGFWHPVGPRHAQPVNDDTLDLWDTRSLAPGGYVLRMKLKDSVGDSLEPDRFVWLNPAGIAEDRETHPQTLGEPMPNPFLLSTELRLTLPTSSRATVSVYDATGRVVRRLIDRVLGPGGQSTYWDGRDARGKRCRPGVYFIRAILGKKSCFRKLTLASSLRKG
jgi:hypothetical protein